MSLRLKLAKITIWHICLTKKYFVSIFDSLLFAVFIDDESSFSKKFLMVFFSDRHHFQSREDCCLNFGKRYEPYLYWYLRASFINPTTCFYIPIPILYFSFIKFAGGEDSSSLHLLFVSRFVLNHFYSYFVFYFDGHDSNDDYLGAICYGIGRVNIFDFQDLLFCHFS